MYAMLVSCLLGSSPSPGPPTLPTQRPASSASEPLLPGGSQQSQGEEGFTVPAEGEADDVSAHLLCAQLPPIRSGFVAINRRIL